MADNVVQYFIKVDANNAQVNMGQFAKQADRASKELEDVAKSSKKAEKGVKETGKESKKAKAGFLEYVQAGGAVAEMLGFIGSAGSTAISAVISIGEAYINASEKAFEFSRSVVDNVNQLNDLNARTGLTTDSIQAVITAFEGSGQSAQAAEAFISRFPRLFADLASGASRASESAKRLGVNIRDSAGNIRSADEVLIDVTNALQNIDDPTERATEGFLLLGRQAGEFLQAFGATSNFENFLELSRIFGVETGPEASAAAARFQEQLAFLNLAFKGLQQRLVNSLGGVDFFNDKLAQAISIVATLGDFIADNQDLFDQFATNLKQAGGDVLGFFQQALPGFASFVNTAFKIISDQFVNVALALKSLGIISDDTFYAFANSARSAEKAVSTLADITTRLGDVDFTGGTGRGVGGRQSAKEAGAIIETILQGVEKSAQDARPQMDGLADSIDKAGSSAQLFFDVSKELPGALQTIEDIGLEFQDIDSSILKATDTVSQLEDAILTLQIAGFDTTESQKLLVEAEKRLGEARVESARKAEEEARKIRQEQALGAVDVVSTVASLDAGAIIGLINPVAGAIADTLIAIGEKSPEEMRAEVQAQAEALANGLAILPTLFLEILPLLATSITEAIYDGLIQLIANLLKMVRDFFTRDRSPEARERRRSRRREAIGDFFNPFESATYMSGGRFLPSAQGGIRYTGMQDGLAMLHRGEFVVPQSGQRPQQVDRQLSGVGGGVNININAAIVERNAVDALVRQIEVRFNNKFGVSSSNLFGGR